MNHLKVQIADKASSWSPKEAYELRRGIFKAIQEAQKKEYEAFVAMQQITQRYTQELLLMLSRDLLNIGVVTGQDTLCHDLGYISGCNLEEWILLQRESMAIATGLQLAEQVYERLNREFVSKAPFGRLSIVFASPADKPTLQSMYDRVNAAKRERDAWSQKKATNDKKRQDFAGRFLRGCLNNIERMRTTNSYNRFISDWMGRFGAEMKQVWEDLCSQEQSLMDEIVNNAQQLKYKYQSAR